MNKEQLIEAIKELPQEFDLEKFLEKVIFMEKVEKGLLQIDHGETISHEKVKELTKKWSK
jgi:hypothetical protein